MLRPGFCLPGPLCDEWGQVLLDAGTCLTETDIAWVEARASGGLYSHSDWPDELAESPSLEEPEEASDAYDQPDAANESTQAIETSDHATESEPEQVTLTALRTGMRLSKDICDENGVLLLRAGTRITRRLLTILGQRNIRSVQTSSVLLQPHGDALRRRYTEQLDELLLGELQKRHALRPVSASERPRLSLEDLKGEAERGAEAHAAARDELGGLFEGLRSNPHTVSERVRSTVNEFVDMVTLDFDLLPTIVGMENSQDEYLFDHCMNVSLVGMAIAAQLGLPREAITQVGLGALLQDVGMLMVPEEIRLAPRALTDDERFEIERHPIYTLDYLERIEGLPSTVRFIGYQVHERADASGYPRQRSGMLIHQFAKIVAVADAYAAMTRPRPHRNSMLPYEAIRTVLTQGSHSKFDRTIIRALLDCVSLFPIGSWVELSNGMRARVIRANPGFHTLPVVMEVDADYNPTGRIIDLSMQPRLRVAFALQPPGEHDHAELIRP